MLNYQRGYDGYSESDSHSQILGTVYMNVGKPGRFYEFDCVGVTDFGASTRRCTGTLQTGLRNWTRLSPKKWIWVEIIELLDPLYLLVIFDYKSIKFRLNGLPLKMTSQNCQIEVQCRFLDINVERRADG
jgi:hypothetical protein